MASYSITIDLKDDDTLAFLQGKSLRVYKSVKTGTKGLPVVWFSQNEFSEAVTFSWTEEYGGYIQRGGKPTPGVTVIETSSKPMNLGQLLTASDTGKVEKTNDGVQGAITVANAGTSDWTCGMGQMLEGKLSPICAFDLGGEGEQIIMMPYETVLLVFESSKQIDTGTVIAEAISSSLTVELDGSNLDRTVIFRKKTGWSENQEGWATENKRNLNLADVLIVSDSVA